MSSLGGQWRVIRHYLSLSNMQAEVEKLVQKIKPATPEQWDSEYCTTVLYTVLYSVHYVCTVNCWREVVDQHTDTNPTRYVNN